LYRTVLTFRAGYDVVYFNSPSRSYGDCQLNPEYIAYNIKALAAKSATGKVFLVAHSQGNINVQWALAFWPSVRQYVAGYVALSGDFKGISPGVPRAD
jgi:pimeloyl-ACP methyl ester carboxylesterase